MSNIFAVIVTYFPGADFPENLAAILPQVEGVVVVHNGGELPLLPPKVTVIHNSSNIGLAAAQNQGIIAALGKGAQWVLLLDDDSRPEPEMLRKMLESYAANPKKEAIGLIAPRIYDRQIQKTYRILCGGKYWFSTFVLPESPPLYVNDLFFAIASGSLIHRWVFEKIGMMREEFFIDHVDTEFCARMQVHGFRLMSAPQAVLSHALGGSTRQGRVICKNYPPERYFTQYRNMCHLVRAYALQLPAYALLNLGSGMRELCRILLYEQHKTAKIKAALRGIRQSFSF